MHEVNLRSIDLNLLVMLRALLDEGSVTKAAERVPMSQPAMSRALTRLRVIFDDPLLVKSGGKMVLTEHAKTLVEPLHQILGNIEALVNPASFEPSTARGQYSIAASDGATLSVLAKFIGNISNIAPNIKFVISNSMTNRLEALKTGELDLVVDVIPETPAGFHTQKLIDDEPVCIVRKEHPKIKSRLTKSLYSQASHIQVMTGTSISLQKSLQRHGIKRHVSLEISSYITAAAIVTETDWLLTLPSILASHIAQMFPVRMFKVPVDIELPSLVQLWHERTDHDLKHKWLRTQIFEAITPKVNEIAF